jgi:hypothetical protein
VLTIVFNSRLIKLKAQANCLGFYCGVADGARTHDNWNHNPGLYQLSYSHHKTFFKSGAPDRNRTCNPRLRRPVLYPVELRARALAIIPGYKDSVDWSGWWDSNSRPSAPKADALTRLRYTPTREANYTTPQKYRQEVFGAFLPYF